MATRFTQADVKKAAEILTDLSQTIIANACKVDMSEPFDSENALRRLEDAVCAKDPQGIARIFNMFPEGDSRSKAEALVAGYTYNDVKSRYATGGEGLLGELLDTHLWPAVVHKLAYEYLLFQFLNIGKRTENMSMLRHVYGIAKERFPEGHDVCLKLSDALLAVGDSIFSKCSDAQAMYSLWTRMPSGVLFNDFHEKVASELILIAKRTENAEVLKDFVANSNGGSPFNRDAALALTHLVVKNEGLVAAIRMRQNFFYSETSNETYLEIKDLLDSLTASDIEKAVAEENTKYLFELYGLFPADEPICIPMVICRIGVKRKDIATLTQLFKQMPQKKYTAAIVLEKLIQLAVDLEDSRTLENLCSCEVDKGIREKLILARVELLHKQGRLT